MAKPYNHRRAENEYKKWKKKDDQFMVKIESQNTIKNQMSTGSFFDDHKDKKELVLTFNFNSR